MQFSNYSALSKLIGGIIAYLLAQIECVLSQSIDIYYVSYAPSPKRQVCPTFFQEYATFAATI